MWVESKGRGQKGRVSKNGWAGGLLVALAMLAVSTMGVSEPIRLSVGHILGQSEAAVAAKLFEEANKDIDDVELFYDSSTTTTYGRAQSRLVKAKQRADLIVLYSGKTAFLDDISGAVRRGFLQQLDALPGFQEAVQPGTLHQNLLSPSSVDGHLWAIPFRACPSCLVVDRKLEIPITGWKDLVDVSREWRFYPRSKGDFFALWMTLLEQRGADFARAPGYNLDAPLYRETFDQIEVLFNACRSAASSSFDVGIASPDVFASSSTVASDYKPCPLPQEGNGKVYPTEGVWYIGLSSEVAGPARAAALRAIAFLASHEFQRILAENSSSPSVRSSGNRPIDEATGVLSAALPHLVLRPGSQERQQAESIMEKAFELALRKPEDFEALMQEASKKANLLLRAETMQTE